MVYGVFANYMLVATVLISSHARIPQLCSLKLAILLVVRHDSFAICLHAY